MILLHICKQAFLKLRDIHLQIFYGIDKCSNTSIGVNVSSDNTLNSLLIYLNNYNSLFKRNITKKHSCSIPSITIQSMKLMFLPSNRL